MQFLITHTRGDNIGKYSRKLKKYNYTKLTNAEAGYPEAGDDISKEYATIEVNSPEEIAEIVKKVGEIVVGERLRDEKLQIEIYDWYRE